MGRLTRRERRARARRRRLALARAGVVLAIAAGLAWSAVTFAPLVDAEPVEYHARALVPVLPAVGTPQIDAWGAASIVLDRALAYVAAVQAQQRLDALRARWLDVHRCEQGDNWYASGSTSDGFFQGGLGIAASLYESIAGHSALLDTPDQQMYVATIAHDVRGARWAPRCEALTG